MAHVERPWSSPTAAGEDRPADRRHAIPHEGLGSMQSIPSHTRSSFPMRMRAQTLSRPQGEGSNSTPFNRPFTPTPQNNEATQFWNTWETQRKQKPSQPRAEIELYPHREQMPSQFRTEVESYQELIKVRQEVGIFIPDDSKPYVETTSLGKVFHNVFVFSHWVRRLKSSIGSKLLYHAVSRNLGGEAGSWYRQKLSRNTRTVLCDPDNGVVDFLEVLEKKFQTRPYVAFQRLGRARYTVDDFRAGKSPFEYILELVLNFMAAPFPEAEYALVPFAIKRMDRRLTKDLASPDQKHRLDKLLADIDIKLAAWKKTYPSHSPDLAWTSEEGHQTFTEGTSEESMLKSYTIVEEDDWTDLAQDTSASIPSQRGQGPEPTPQKPRITVTDCSGTETKWHDKIRSIYDNIVKEPQEVCPLSGRCRRLYPLGMLLDRTGYLKDETPQPPSKPFASASH